MSISSSIPSVTEFGITVIQNNQKEEFVKKQLEHIHTKLKRSAPNIPESIRSLYDRHWEAIPDARSNPDKHHYNAVTKLLLSSYLPDLTQFIDSFCALREKFQLLKENRYIEAFYGDSLWCYNFSIINNVDALALVFLYESKNSKLTPDDINTLNLSLSSTNEEVVEVAKCLLYSNEYYSILKKVYASNAIPLHRVAVISSFFDDYVDKDGKIPDFASPLSIALINGITRYFNGFVKRLHSGSDNSQETMNYPLKEELIELKTNADLWHVESKSIKNQYIESYESLKTLQRQTKKSLEFQRKYFVHLLDEKFPTTKKLPTILEFYQSCKAEQQLYETSSSSPLISPPSPSENISPINRRVKKGKKKPQRGAKTALREVTQQPSTEKIDSTPCPPIEKQQKQPLEAVNKIVTDYLLHPTPAPIFTKISKVNLNYHERVLRWLSDEWPASLMEDSEYANLTKLGQKIQHLCHGFTQIVDDFLFNDYAIKDTWINKTTSHKDKLYFIPGEIHVMQKRMRGLFMYCIGQDSVCYHRYFSMQSKSTFMQYANPTFYKVDYPSLQEAQIDESLLEEFTYNESHGEATITVNPINHLVKIRDPKHAADLYLYKPVVDNPKSLGL